MPPSYVSKPISYTSSPTFIFELAVITYKHNLLASPLASQFIHDYLTAHSVPQMPLALSSKAFSRSCCYTVWSAIGIIRLSVCLSVCPSLCLSVTLCIVALRVGVHGYKLHQRVPSRHVSICPFRHFCCRMYRLATKCATKKRIEETRVCISLYRLLTVQPRDLISLSRYQPTSDLYLGQCMLHAWVSGFVSALRNGEWDPIFPFQPLIGLNL